MQLTKALFDGFEYWKQREDGDWITDEGRVRNIDDWKRFYADIDFTADLKLVPFGTYG